MKTGRTQPLHADLANTAAWVNRVRERLAVTWVRPDAADFLNGWSNRGAPYLPATAHHTGGRVYLEGVVAGGTLGAALFTLPDPFRPTATVHFLVAAGGAAATLEVDAEGNVTVSGGSNTAVQLDGVTYWSKR